MIKLPVRRFSGLGYADIHDQGIGVHAGVNKTGIVIWLHIPWFSLSFDVI